MPVELTDALFQKAAGWEAVKRARAYLELDQVLSSDWQPPVLRGVVQTGEVSFRAGLIIQGPIDIENLCTCRDSREWGKICAHSVAVGLHWMKSRLAPATPAARGSSASAATSRPAGARDGVRLQLDPGGVPAELFILFPPNFVDALARGKLMLVFEASHAGGRVPLNALPKEQSFAFAKSDAALIARLEELAGETPATLVLETKDFVALLPLLAGSPGISIGRGTRIEVTLTPFAPPLKATLEASGEILVELRGAFTPPPLLAGEWAWQNQRLQPFGLPAALRGVMQMPMRIPRYQVPIFMAQFWPQLAGTDVEANFGPEDFILEPHPPRFLLELKGGLAQLTALLQCAYGTRILTPGVTSQDEGLWLPEPGSSTRYSTRDVASERAALGRLQRAGFRAPDDRGRMQMNGQDAVLNFFAREFPRLQREWEVTLEERLDRSTRENLERIAPRFQITSSGVQWFDLGMVFESGGGEKFAAADIQRLLLGGRSHTRLKNGKFAVIDTGAVEEMQEVLLDCSPEQHAGGYRINNTQAGFLEATLRQRPEWTVQAPADWRHRAAQQSGEAKLECPPLGGLDEVLRPYQKDGVAWLRFLRENGFGGILADEMGLGKTLQVLALLQSGRGDSPASPALVVCPTSLVHNWVAEAKKFTPGLRVLALHGAERHEQFAFIAQSDVVVTSYALIRRDAERYQEIEFDTMILDEAQHIKNRQTQNAQAVKSVRARHRLVLTGTPLENSVLDLWSIFDFLMPGYLGGAQDFRERYEGPIARDKNPEAQARLARRLRPFLLRRLKREVASDLPARLEQVSLCELTPDQRAVYRQLLEASRNQILDAVGAQGLARSRMLVLTTLLRLRQVCCDLRLLDLEAQQRQNIAPSGKLELFNELMEEVLDGGHRALVFSQFTTMLSLLKDQLAADGIEFCYLDGSTTNRAEVVRRFQETPAIPVFLISLKAGGVGLNLTGADTVIHFDPWWNPAVEDQATDRAHRIGQTRVVTSYKLIARDTIEEKILLLQQRKREVIAATLGGDEAFTEALTWEEIQGLLE
ncbi:MAG: hypothetical protein QOF48_2353 [Verrucomicrobiota bacterium]